MWEFQGAETERCKQNWNYLSVKLLPIRKSECFFLLFIFTFQIKGLMPKFDKFSCCLSCLEFIHLSYRMRTNYLYYLLKTCHVMWVEKLEAASSSNSINQPQRTEGRWKGTFLEHPGNLYSRLGPWDRSPAPAELAVGLWGCFQRNGVFPLKTFVPLKEGTGLAACRLDLRWHLWTSEHQCLESQLNHLPVC